MREPTYILKTNRELLKRAAANKTRFAKDLGIHITTLNSLLDDSWKRIERDTIERLCDVLKCRLTDVFDLESDRFWEPYLAADFPAYRILRGSVTIKGTKLPLEEPAKSRVNEFFLEHLETAGGFEEVADEAEVLTSVRNDNCVIIGAHPSNRAWEPVVCRLFGAEPFKTSHDNLSRIPFRLVKDDYGRRSALVQRRSTRSSSPKGLGIYSERLGRLIVEVTRWSPEKYPEARTTDGVDAAIVIVANRPLATTHNVKTVVLAGFSRVGTLAAAEALARDYRDIEPTRPDGLTVGVLSVKFSKTVEGDNRVLRGSQWEYLYGGRRTVLPPDYPEG